jgi:transaldolase
MPQNQLSQLADMSVVVADTGDIRSIERFAPTDATTNPSLIVAAVQQPEYAGLVEQALLWARHHGQGQQAAATLAVDRLAVEFGLRILDLVPGRVSTEVDARLSYDTEATVERARQLIEQYEAAGAGRDRILIKIASTWQGIAAAKLLEQEGIHCNLTLLFGFHQAVACAEAGVTLVSPFVGRILDWFRKSTGREDYPATEDPGVRSVTAIYHYYKRHGYGTEVMGASFRNKEEILELAGCDLLTISPTLLAELLASTGQVERKLAPPGSGPLPVTSPPLDDATFHHQHEADQMAREKLAEGIAGFSEALVGLEELLHRWPDRPAGGAVQHNVSALEREG